MKKNIYLLALMLCCFSFFTTAQDDPCEGMEDEIVCVEFAPGLVIPMPVCEAMLTNLLIVDCEDIDDPTGGGDPIEECDCDWSTDEYICVSFFGDIMEVHPCEVECAPLDSLGFMGEMEIVDCGEIVYGCTDQNALNYNPEASVNDGSCEYEPIEECDCDWSTDEYICVSFFGDIMEVHPCEVECAPLDSLGFMGEMEIVDCGEIVYGCTDQNALNYNPEASVNDGSCEYEPIEECDCDWSTDEYICVSFFGDIMEVHPCEVECAPLDSLGFMGEMEIVDCGEIVYGCTDQNALNYNPEASVNDGSCEYEPIEECDCDWSTDEYICVSFFGDIMEVHPCEVECAPLDSLGFMGEMEIVDCGEIMYGCTDQNALNYDPIATVDNGSCEYEPIEECDCDWSTDEYICVSFFGDIMEVHPCEVECGHFEVMLPLGEIEIVDCVEIVYGCTDQNALNYDPIATVDNGSCEYEPVEECDCDWSTDDYVCVSFGGAVWEVHACEVECTPFDALGFMGEIEIVDCDELVYGCDDPNALNYDPEATVNNGSCEYDNSNGCDCDYSTDEVICVDFGEGNIGELHPCDLECIQWFAPLIIVDCDGDDFVYGCTDPAALNYDENATWDDGSCEYEEDPNGCDCDWSSEEMVCISFGDGDMFPVHACEIECGLWAFDGVDMEFEIVDCDDIAYGCTDPAALNYDENATWDDGSCQYDEDPNGCNCDWSSEEMVCISFGDGDMFPVHACEIECGFWAFDGVDNEFEIVDCDDVVFGCMDPSALNYNADATVEDGSCEYDENPNGCDCDYNSDETICVDFGDGNVVELHICDVECVDWFAPLTIVDCDGLVYGCMDPAALNYDETATVDDWSCEYEENPNGCDCDWESDDYICISLDGVTIFTVHACELECGLWSMSMGGANGGPLDFEIEIVDCDGETGGDDVEGDGDDVSDFIEGLLQSSHNDPVLQTITDFLLDVVLFPNPVNNGTLGVNIDYSAEGTASVNIYNGIGQTVYTQNTALVPGTNRIEIDVNELESGLYYTVVTAGNGKSVSEKFIKN